MLEAAYDKDAVAIRLALALKRLRARLREESSGSAAGLAISQLSILQRLLLTGPATAASLAAAEHVSQQAIAQSLLPLRSAGLVASEPDPKDGRKTLISVTNAGLRLRESIIASRNSWLAGAIDSTVDAEERAALDKAVELLERLADADT
jgi:DNA-binding MarR family transcriptional regulator